MQILALPFSRPAAAPFCLALAALLCLAGPAAAQRDGIVFHGMNHRDGFGMDVDFLSDINLDGKPEILAAAFCFDVNGVNSGGVKILDGSNGHIIRMIFGDSARDRLGEACANAGDVNGDGFDDIIAGARRDDRGAQDSGSAFVYDGVTGSILHIVSGTYAEGNFGVAVDGAGDINGDGHADFVVGANLEDSVGEDNGGARVYSGLDGSLLHKWPGARPGELFGTSVSGGRDIDGDGVPDVAVGAPFARNGAVMSGRAYALSGRTGLLIQAYAGEYEGDRFGASVEIARDIDGDGLADLVVGAQGGSQFLKHAGAAYAFASTDGSILHRFVGDSAADQCGMAVAGVGDVDGDGLEDLLVGSPFADVRGRDSGHARLYSGADGSVLATYLGESRNDYFGASLIGGEDLNGDGVPDLIVGAPNAGANGFEPGSLTLYFAKTRPLPEVQNLVAGQTAWFYWHQGDPGTRVDLYVSTVGFGATLLVSPFYLDLANDAVLAASGVVDAAGTASLSVSMPSDLWGQDLYFQLLHLGSSWRPSRAVRATVQ